MGWLKRIRQAIKSRCRSTETAASEDKGGSRSEAQAEVYHHGLREPFRGCGSAAGERPVPHFRQTGPLHTHADIETEAQEDYGAFEIVICNDTESNTYRQTIEGDYSALMYSALMLLEYMGKEDEEKVMLACLRLATAAKLYHKKHVDRLASDARALFAGAPETGVLDVDFL